MMIARLILPLTEPLFDTFEATVKAASPGCTAHVAISRGAATVKLGWPGRFPSAASGKTTNQPSGKSQHIIFRALGLSGQRPKNKQSDAVH
jgi:hypothetical protein